MYWSRATPTARSTRRSIRSFESLAKELGASSIGVILSGTGSDGVEGIHAIKAAGGTMLVQDPETAKQDGMPRAAIATGKVDLVLPPAGSGRGAGAARPSTRAEADGRCWRARPGAAPRQLERSFSRCSRGPAASISRSTSCRPSQRRIQRRMTLHKKPPSSEYIKHLKENPAEVQQLYQDILIHVTRFFREPESFEALADEVFPQPAGRAQAARRRSASGCPAARPAKSRTRWPWRSWNFCSSGTRTCRCRSSPPTSARRRSSRPAPASIRRASPRTLSPERLRRFFTKTDGRYRINKSIRDLCVFARQDLTRDPPFSKLDLIVCRNVLIYLGQPMQNRLISVFHYALKPTGYLMLGSAETIGPQPTCSA